MQCTPRRATSRPTRRRSWISGATVCTRHKPLCAYCPLRGGLLCAARPAASTSFPRRAARGRARRATGVHGGRDARRRQVLLERRPDERHLGWLVVPAGIRHATAAASSYVRQQLRERGRRAAGAELRRARFTHFDLVITPLLARCAGPRASWMQREPSGITPREPARIGLPAPIKTLLETCESTSCAGDRVVTVPNVQCV